MQRLSVTRFGGLDARFQNRCAVVQCRRLPVLERQSRQHVLQQMCWQVVSCPATCSVCHPAKLARVPSRGKMSEYEVSKLLASKMMQARLAASLPCLNLKKMHVAPCFACCMTMLPLGACADIVCIASSFQLNHQALLDLAHMGLAMLAQAEAR